MSITGHYIDTLLNGQNAWMLKEEQLAFTPIKGRHNAVNQAKLLIQTIERYSLQGKVWALHCIHSKDCLITVEQIG